jgi:hypothetical protein
LETIKAAYPANHLELFWGASASFPGKKPVQAKNWTDVLATSHPSNLPIIKKADNMPIKADPAVSMPENKNHGDNFRRGKCLIATGIMLLLFPPLSLVLLIAGIILIIKDQQEKNAQKQAVSQSGDETDVPGHSDATKNRNCTGMIQIMAYQARRGLLIKYPSASL